MKNTSQRFELKLRQNGANKKNKEPAKGTKGVFKAFVCLMLTAFVVVLKCSSSSSAKSVVDEIARIVSSQTDFSMVSEQMVQGVDELVGRYFKGAATASTGEAEITEKLILPMAHMSLSQEFASGEHPVFKTDTSPSGIVLKGAGGDFVYAPGNAKISEVIKEDDAGYRITMKLNNELSVRFGGLKLIYFKEGARVEGGSIIGALPKEGAELEIEVFALSDPVDPLDYFDINQSE